MTEELGHGAQGSALHDQPGRERVPKIVPGEVFDLRHLKCGVKAILDVPDRLSGLARGVGGEFLICPEIH